MAQARMSSMFEIFLQNHSVAFVPRQSLNSLLMTQNLCRALVSKSYNELFRKCATPLRASSISQRVFITGDSSVVFYSKKRVYLIRTLDLSIVGNSQFAYCNSTSVCVSCFRKSFLSWVFKYLLMIVKKYIILKH